MRLSVALLALAALTAATPLISVRDYPTGTGDTVVTEDDVSRVGSGDEDSGGGKTNDEPPDDDDPLATKEGLCDAWDLTTNEGVDELWDKTGAGVVLDLFIKSRWDHSAHWVTGLENDIRGGSSGKSGAPGCSTLGTDCDPMDGLTCAEHFDKYGGPISDGVAYWVFQAVKRMHGKFGELSRQLTQDTLISGLKIPQMIDDFDGNEDEAGNTLAWLSAAFTMAGALASAFPGVGSAVGAGFSLLGGLFAGISSTVGDETDQGTISNSLAETFDKATTHIEDTLRIATAGGTSEEEDSLPAPKWDTFETKIAKLFNGGWFLLDDDTQSVADLFESVTPNLQRKVASEVIKASGLKLVADPNIRSADDCRGPGFQWLEAGPESFCFWLGKSPAISDHVLGGPLFVIAGDGVYESMASYGLDDVPAFFRANIDCELNGGDKKDVDVGNMVSGEVPLCFFNVPVVIDPHVQVWL